MGRGLKLSLKDRCSLDFPGFHEGVGDERDQDMRASARSGRFSGSLFSQRSDRSATHSIAKVFFVYTLTVVQLWKAVR